MPPQENVASGVLLVEHHDARRDACAVEEVRRQADDPLDVALPDDVAADVRLGVAPVSNAQATSEYAISSKC